MWPASGGRGVEHEAGRRGRTRVWPQVRNGDETVLASIAVCRGGVETASSFAPPSPLALLLRCVLSSEPERQQWPSALHTLSRLRCFLGFSVSLDQLKPKRGPEPRTPGQGYGWL